MQLGFTVLWCKDDDCHEGTVACMSVTQWVCSKKQLITWQSSRLSQIKLVAQQSSS